MISLDRFNSDQKIEKATYEDRTDFLPELPLEIWLSILSYLEVSDLGRCQQVSREWRAITNHDKIWQAFAKQHGVEVKEGEALKAALDQCVWSNKQLIKRVRDFINSWQINQKATFSCQFLSKPEAYLQISLLCAINGQEIQDLTKTCNVGDFYLGEGLLEEAPNKDASLSNQYKSLSVVIKTNIKIESSIQTIMENYLKRRLHELNISTNLCLYKMKEINKKTLEIENNRSDRELISVNRQLRIDEYFHFFPILWEQLEKKIGKHQNNQTPQLSESSLLLFSAKKRKALIKKSSVKKGMNHQFPLG